MTLSQLENILRKYLRSKLAAKTEKGHVELRNLCKRLVTVSKLEYLNKALHSLPPVEISDRRGEGSCYVNLGTVSLISDFVIHDAMVSSFHYRP